jgi:hypothetical protein
MSRNEDSFRAVFEVLGDGAAVGIFPGGHQPQRAVDVAIEDRGGANSHSAQRRRPGVHAPSSPSASRLREKETFRSDAFVVRGTAIEWSDLAHRGPDDGECGSRIDIAHRRRAPFGDDQPRLVGRSADR